MDSNLSTHPVVNDVIIYNELGKFLFLHNFYKFTKEILFLYRIFNNIKKIISVTF